MPKKINFQFLISYLGLIPYVLTFLDKYYFLVVEEEDLLNFVTYYSLIIIVFSMAVTNGMQNEIKNKIYSLNGFFSPFVMQILKIY